jgi:hypothetical protein
MGGVEMVARRRLLILGSLIAATVSAASVTWQALPATAGTNGTLFGLNPAPGAVFAIDPSTGASTKLTDLPVDQTGQPPTFFGLASDPAHHLLFTVRAFYTDSTFTTIRWQVVTIDSRTGATAMSPALARDVPSDLAFDPSTGGLFGVSGSQAPQTVVRIDPATGAITHIADLPGQFAGRFAYAPASHTVYVPTQEFVNFNVLNVVITVDTLTGAVSQSLGMTVPIDQVVYDSSSGVLFGKGGGPPASIFRLDPTTGAQTLVAPTQGTFFQTMSIDSAAHTIYVKNDEFPPTGGSVVQSIQSVNDQTGAYTVGTGALPTDWYINTLVFEGAAAITPASVAADVRQSFASGAIQTQGLENALLAQLEAAADARARGQCGTAADIYAAVIRTLRAQSGHHIDTATASQLIAELQFLIDNCP